MLRQLKFPVFFVFFSYKLLCPQQNYRSHSDRWTPGFPGGIEDQLPLPENPILQGLPFALFAHGLLPFTQKTGRQTNSRQTAGKGRGGQVVGQGSWVDFFHGHLAILELKETIFYWNLPLVPLKWLQEIGHFVGKVEGDTSVESKVFGLGIREFKLMERWKSGQME